MNIDEEMVDAIIDNDELTDNQRSFCLYYIKSFNATQSYQKAYGCSYTSAVVNGSRLLTYDYIISEVNKLKQAKFNRQMLSADDIFQQMIDIAFADVTDFVEFNNKNLTLKDSAMVNGQVINEVSVDKGSPKIKLHDKIQALKWLGDRMDLLPTNVGMKLEMEREKLDHALDNSDEVSTEDKLKSFMSKLGDIVDES